mgnify:CR=1 FL=1
MKDELIQISGKAYKQCEVVMLPTNDQTQIAKAHKSNYLIYADKPMSDTQNNRAGYTNQHLYILSSEEIKEGDWYMYCHFGEWIISNSKETLKNKTNTLENLNKDNYFKKVIATTDSSLVLKENISKSTEECWKYDSLPKPSDDFISKYVKKEGKGFDKVLVETCSNWKNVERGNPDKYLGEKIKVASDNTITIKPFQEVYVSKKALPFVIEALGFNPLEEDFLGKEAIRYCKEKDYEGSAFYNVAMKAIEFGYQLAQKEIESEEKTSWSREEIIQLLTKFSKNYLGKIPNWLQKQIDEWIEENL